jgi:hypothetical protein
VCARLPRVSFVPVRVFPSATVRVYVCVYVCAYVCVCDCMCDCAYVCVYVWALFLQLRETSAANTSVYHPTSRMRVTTPLPPATLPPHNPRPSATADPAANAKQPRHGAPAPVPPVLRVRVGAVRQQQLHYRDHPIGIGANEQREPAAENTRPGDTNGACRSVRSSAVLAEHARC